MVNLQSWKNVQAVRRKNLFVALKCFVQPRLLLDSGKVFYREEPLELSKFAHERERERCRNPFRLKG